MTKYVEYSEQEHIGIITIAREEKLNALNSEVLEEFRSLLESLADDRKLTGLIVTGKGEKAFIAGADIKEIGKLNSSDAHQFALKGQQVTTMIEECRFPIIAAVNGLALGGGLEMALACDFIYASSNASFALPEVGLGLIPGFGGTQRLSKVVGRARAKELTFTGRKINISEAEKYGLVLQSFETKDDLITGAKSCLMKISNNSPLAVGVAKSAINSGVDLLTSDGLAIEAQSFSNLFDSEDMKEGIQSFLEKRKANFKGE